MNDYMKALHQRFFREPDFTEMEEDIENTRQKVRDCLDREQRRTLMHLVDTQNLLREETSVASLTRCAGASPAPASPLPPMVRFVGIVIHSEVLTSVTTMDRGCDRLLWPAAWARN